MSATNSNSFLARLSIIKRLWLAFGLLVVLSGDVVLTLIGWEVSFWRHGSCGGMRV